MASMVNFFVLDFFGNALILNGIFGRISGGIQIRDHVAAEIIPLDKALHPSNFMTIWPETIDWS
jgi:hypothetical protein